MAWRVAESVVRGEIDNRTRGRVIGRIWFTGTAVPVELDLKGDCWRDLAGRRLEFINPQPEPAGPHRLAGRQSGTTGDITASHRVKVTDIPLDQLGEYYAARKPFPWHWGNALYLEWFSEANGRVVIETVDFEMKIVGDPTWDMTTAGEEAQRQANGVAMQGFMNKLGEALAREHPGCRLDDVAETNEEDDPPVTR